MRHYSEADLLELYYLPQESSVAAIHVQDCTRCTETLQRLEGKLRHAKSACPAAEARPETFWTRQRLSILRAIERRGPAQVTSHVPLSRYAAAAVIVIVASTGLFIRMNTDSQRPVKPSASSSQGSIEETLPVDAQAGSDPWESEELREFGEVVQWESWISAEGESGGTL